GMQAGNKRSLRTRGAASVRVPIRSKFTRTETPPPARKRPKKCQTRVRSKAIQVVLQGRHRSWPMGHSLFQAAHHETIQFARQSCPLDAFAKRSKRSRSITFAHAATKSRRNACCESSHA